MQIGLYISLLKSQQPDKTERKKLSNSDWLQVSSLSSAAPWCVWGEARSLKATTWLTRAEEWDVRFLLAADVTADGDIFISWYLLSYHLYGGSIQPSIILFNCFTAKTSERSNISTHFSRTFFRQQKFCTSETFLRDLHKKVSFLEMGEICI